MSEASLNSSSAHQSAHSSTTALTANPTLAIPSKDYAAYQKLLATGKYQRHHVPKPGDRLPIEGIDATVISADGNLIDHPLPGGETKHLLQPTRSRPPDQTENARSLGVLIPSGKLRILDLGDLTWDKESELMCPTNKLGHVNILVVSHHGWYQSSSPALVDAIHPQIAIMDNGVKKGGSNPVTRDLQRHPRSRSTLAASLL